MTTRNETFNGLREFPLTGVYFELLSTVNAVDVTAYAQDGRVLSSEKAVQAGFWIDRRNKEPFVRIEITTGASEAVKFLATDGMSGNRSVPSTISSTVFPIGNTHVQAKKTVTNASASMLAANASRRYLCVQNQDATGNIYIRTDGAAAVADASCVKIGPGQMWEPLVPPLGAVFAIGDIASNANVMALEV